MPTHNSNENHLLPEGFNFIRTQVHVGKIWVFDSKTELFGDYEEYTQKQKLQTKTDSQMAFVILKTSLPNGFYLNPAVVLPTSLHRGLTSSFATRKRHDL